eukprot:TRINITY_DN1125_c0_g4_i1.p1 TRINITY_DN1125_c0_g4~~TRINITY_DN1125_c0_g4_i1.p1  ORF type:complete len:200 (-),score=68.05 TRINITY_DN1125_c0_g4_i1:218-793(-)
MAHPDRQHDQDDEEVESSYGSANGGAPTGRSAYSEAFSPRRSSFAGLPTEQQIMVFARQQAQRDEEIAKCRRNIQLLEEEVAELEHENRLRSQQEAVLKEELRRLDRNEKRESVDMTYLKNVVLKLLETGEVNALLPVLQMLLQLSPEEVTRVRAAYEGSSTATQSDAVESGALSFLSRTWSFVPAPTKSN